MSNACMRSGDDDMLGRSVGASVQILVHCPSIRKGKFHIRTAHLNLRMYESLHRRVYTLCATHKRII